MVEQDQGIVRQIGHAPGRVDLLGRVRRAGTALVRRDTPIGIGQTQHHLLHQVAEVTLPCRNRTGVPISGPVNRIRVVIRELVIVCVTTPGRVGVDMPVVCRG